MTMKFMFVKESTFPKKFKQGGGGRARRAGAGSAFDWLLQAYFCERKRETSVEAGGVTRDENSCVCSGGSNPRNTTRWTQITAQ